MHITYGRIRTHERNGGIAMKKDACDWLREYLKGGPKDVSKIRKDAREAGYSRAELREAKFICLVRVTNNWGREHPADKWFWSLPLEEA